MGRWIILSLLLAATLSVAQSPEEKNFTLQQRYTAMKAKAETYQDYKVIKEYAMDGVWKIMMDSLAWQKSVNAEARQTISKLNADVSTIQLTLKNEREAAAEVVHNSTHIAVLGIEFKKSVFLVSIAVILVSLFFIGSALITKMKLLRDEAKEKILIANILTLEFDEFKHKAMEKQIKLARELQDERNKLAELKLR